MLRHMGKQGRRPGRQSPDGPESAPEPRSGAGNDGPSRSALTLQETLSVAKQAAWRGEPARPAFDRALEFATCGDCSLIFLRGEYVGEVSVHLEQRTKCLPHSLLTVYREFNAKHSLYFASDPRRYAPGFSNDLGMFPSRDTAAIALLEALSRRGSLRRFESSWNGKGGPLQWLSFSSVSLARPWYRLTYDGLELGWVMVDRDATKKRNSWSFIGPPALGDRREQRFFASRDDAAVALVEELQRGYAAHRERFKTGPCADPADNPAWNLAAVNLLRRLEDAGETGRPARLAG